MQKYGKGKISIESLKEIEEKRKKWRQYMLYTSMIAGLTSYFSLILLFLSLIGFSALFVNIFGVCFAIVVIVLLALLKLDVIEKIRNKRLLNDILDAFGISGILGFVIEKFTNILPEQMRNYSERWPYIVIVVAFLIMPVVSWWIIRKKPEWHYNED